MTQRLTLSPPWIRLILFIIILFIAQAVCAQAPTLGTYPSTTVVAGRNAVVTPSVAPTSATSAVAYSSTDFKGVLTADNATGVVNITAAMHAGVYAITVKAINGIGSATATFTLTVTNPNCSNSDFMAPTTLTGLTPQGVAIGDFNEDGNQDVATANNGANSISVRFGDGLGGLTTGPDITVGAGPRHLAVGDFDCDGNLDIVNSNVSSAMVSVTLGDGMGGFVSAPNVPVAAFPTGISVGNFNNDNFPDFVVGTSGTAVSVRLGDGLGGFVFAPGLTVPAGSAWTIGIGDFNEDGNQDLAITSTSAIQIRLGNGAGGFTGTTSVAVGAGCEQVVIGDFNNDNHQDFAVACASTNAVSVRLGNGTGAFSGTTEVPAGSIPTGVSIGDINGDGNEDLVIMRNGAYVPRLGDGLGNFTGTSSFSSGGSSNRRVAIGDLDNDNYQDVVIANESGNLVVRRGNAGEITVSGNTVNITDGDVTPSLTDFTDFGAVCSTSKTRTFRITNTGLVSLSGIAVTITGTNAADFVLSSAPVSGLAASGFSEFVITFTPSGSGPRNATISISSTDCDETIFDFAVTGMLSAPVSGTTVVTNVACFGGSNGAINLTPNGGTAPYTFNWLPSGPTTEDRTGAVAGTYSVQITDANGCTGTVTASVTQPGSLVVTVAAQTNVITFGGNNGAASINTPTGGVAPYTINWIPGNPTGDGTTSVTGLTAGTWTCTVTDANGCIATQTFLITQPGCALNFDGIDDHVQVASPTGVPIGNSAYTMEAWIKPFSFGNRGIVGWGNYGAGNEVNALRLDGAGQVVNYWWGNDLSVSPTNTFGGSPSINLLDGNWHHVAATFDGTTRKIYVDGYLKGQDTPVGHNVTSTANFRIGSTCPFCGGQIFHGDIDEVRVWNRGLCQEEIQNNMSCEIPTTGTGLVANYHFNQGSAAATNTSVNTLTDASGSGNHGTLVGFALNGATSNWKGPGAVVSGTSCSAFTAPVTLSSSNGQTNVSCFGGSNGAASVTATGGSGLIYNWAPGNPTGDGTANVSGLTAGSWTCTVTNACGANASVTFTITQPLAPVSGTTVITNVSCFGGSNGAINLTPTGGTNIGLYSYTWLPSGPTSEDRTGLTAGTYSVLITDNAGCTGTVAATVTQPPSPISFFPATQTNVSCFGGSNGALTVNPASGGTGSFTYDWAPGNPTGDGTTSVTGLTAGTWTVTATDANGCTAFVNFNITQPQQVSFTAASQTNVSCFGGSNGAFAVNPALGGTGAFTYDWAPGNPTGDGTTSVTGLTAGTWTVTATDANGCTAFVNFNITQPQQVSFTAASQTNVSCFGGSNGAFAVNPALGGTGAFTYNWAPGNPTGDGTTSVTGLTAGTWTVTATDANGCSASINFNITQPQQISFFPASQTNVSCFGGSNGAFAVNPAFGGTGSFTYDWAPGNPTGDGTTSVTGLTAGTWTVTATDANGCSASINFNITQPQQISFTAASQTNVSCFGGSNGAFAVNPAFGGTGAFTYDWAPGNPTGDGTTAVTGLTAGTWTVTATDANGCSAFINFNITEPSAISFTAASQTNVSCFGGSNGAFSVNPALGGTGAFTYDWAPGNPTGDGTTSVTGLTAGTWTVTATDANGCSAFINFNITEPSDFAVITMQTNVNCNGGNGDATVIVFGATAPYSYAWSSGGTGSAESGLTAGNYSVIITDANSCSTTATFTITEPSALAFSATQTDISCNGGNNGDATVTMSGGVSPYTYAWSSGGTSATETGLAAGTYSVDITDANSCSTSATFTITEPDAITSAMTQTDVLCNGGNNGTATVTPAGGTGPYTYGWSSGGTGATETGLIAGIYSVSITDANSCSASATLTITEPTAITFTTTQTDVSCNGGNNGDATVTVSGGTGAFSYAWSSGGTTATETGLAAGNYSVIITDENLCSTTATFVIAEPAVLAATVVTAVNPTTCGGTDGAIDINASGGTAPYTFLWSNSDPNEDLTAIAAGAYSVAITDANGCTTTVSATINDPNAPAVTLSLPMDTACGSFPGTILLSGETPAGGTWSGNTVSGNTFDPFTAGVGIHFIAYTFTDINGCTASATDSLYVDLCMSVETVTATSWNVFPNPTNGAINVTTTGELTGDVIVEIYSADGKLISSENKQQATVITLDLTTEPVGTYFIKIISNEQVSTHRVVKMH